MSTEAKLADELSERARIAITSRYTGKDAALDLRAASAISRLSAEVQELREALCRAEERFSQIETAGFSQTRQSTTDLLLYARSLAADGSIRARAAIPSEQGEAVGEAGTMLGTDGFTMEVFRAADVPVGTKLYTHPAPAAGVKVKALEWKAAPDEMGRNGWRFIGAPAIGLSYVASVMIHGQRGERWEIASMPGDFPTLDAAKAAAQADYEARILSALDQGEPL